MFAGFIFSPILCSIYKEGKGHKDYTYMTIVKTDAEFQRKYPSLIMKLLTTLAQQNYFD